MSSKRNFAFLFDENYLNEHRDLIDHEINAAVCKGCGVPFRKGDWLFSKPSYKGKLKRYHLSCAFRLLLVNKVVIQAPKYRNVVYALMLTAWLMETSRYLLLGQS